MSGCRVGDDVERCRGDRPAAAPRALPGDLPRVLAGKKFVFFTGKGGQGKTSVACATALALADGGKKTLLVSTDPASNLGQALGLADGGFAGVSAAVGAPSSVCGNLWAANVDPEKARGRRPRGSRSGAARRAIAGRTSERRPSREKSCAARERSTGHDRPNAPSQAAAAYRKKALRALMARGADDDELDRAEEGLAGQCTVEIAAFDAFAGVLARPDAAYDVVVFDTAPTGHTLRLLGLAWEWTAFFGKSPTGASCLGPVEALAAQAETFAAARAALADGARTALLLVARPESSALAEAARTAGELAALDVAPAGLVLNGVLETPGDDAVAKAFAAKQRAALAGKPENLQIVASLALAAFDVVGLGALRALVGGPPPPAAAPKPVAAAATHSLAAVVDELARGPPTVVLLVGKGGVGKTTLAAAVGVGLAARGLRTHVTTTDPAAHVAATLGSSIPNLTVDAVDAAAATRAYVERAVAAKGPLSARDEALLREELDSPCTEELAVFDAFAEKIVMDGFVVVDTAPTGHTLLLLDQTGAYQRDVDKHRESGGGGAAAATPLELLRARATILVVALPEPTPVAEALALEADLRRAGLPVAGFVVNQLVPATDHAVLGRRAAAQAGRVAAVAAAAATTRLGVVAVPWRGGDLVGADALRALCPEGAAHATYARAPPPKAHVEAALPSQVMRDSGAAGCCGPGGGG